jgi:hypothetical protein
MNQAAPAQDGKQTRYTLPHGFARLQTELTSTLPLHIIETKCLKIRFSSLKGLNCGAFKNSVFNTRLLSDFIVTHLLNLIIILLGPALGMAHYEELLLPDDVRSIS